MGRCHAGPLCVPATAIRTPQPRPTHPQHTDGHTHPPSHRGVVIRRKNETLTRSSEREKSVLLRAPVSTVEDWARRAILPSVKIGRRRLYVRQDIEAVLTRQHQADAERHGVPTVDRPSCARSARRHTELTVLVSLDARSLRPPQITKETKWTASSRFDCSDMTYRQAV
jgi:hypothetical protein